MQLTERRHRHHQNGADTSRFVLDSGECFAEQESGQNLSAGKDSQPDRATPSTASVSQTQEELPPELLESRFSSRPSPEDVAIYIKRGYHKIRFDEDTKLEDYPMGCSRLTAFQKSDDDLGIFRRFKEPHTRILLELSIEIVQLQKALHTLEKANAEDERLKHRLKRTVYEDTVEPNVSNAARIDLVEKMRTKLNQYDELLLRYNQIDALGKPARVRYLSLFRWIWNTKPLKKGYHDFIFEADDFVSVTNYGLKSSTSGKLEDYIQSWFYEHPRSRLINWFTSKKDRGENESRKEKRFSRVKLTRVAEILAGFISIVTLLTPLCLCLFVPMSQEFMAMALVCFVLMFYVLLSVLTKAHLLERFIATSAYAAAIFVTYLGNMKQYRAQVSGN